MNAKVYQINSITGALSEMPQGSYGQIGADYSPAGYSNWVRCGNCEIRITSSAEFLLIRDITDEVRTK